MRPMMRLAKTLEDDWFHKDAVSSTLLANCHSLSLSHCAPIPLTRTPLLSDCSIVATVSLSHCVTARCRCASLCHWLDDWLGDWPACERSIVLPEHLRQHYGCTECVQEARQGRPCACVPGMWSCLYVTMSMSLCLPPTVSPSHTVIMCMCWVHIDLCM